MIKSKLIPASWEIPEYFHRRLGDQPGRQRAMCQSGNLLLVLHEPPTPGELKRRHRLIYRSVDGNWLATARGSGLAELQGLLDTYNQQLTDLETSQETADTAADYFSLIEKIIPLRRSLGNLYQTLQEAREQLPDLRELINFRDQAYELSRTVELLHEEVQNGMELTRIRKAEEQSHTAHLMAVQGHRLNLLAGFFLPLVTLASIFSMNPSMSFQEIWQSPSLVSVCVIGLALGATLCWTVIAQRRSQRRST